MEKSTAKPDLGTNINSILTLSPKEAFNLCEQGAILIDVRENYMNRIRMFDIKNLIFCPFSILLENLTNLPKSPTLIFADATGLKSK